MSNDIPNVVHNAIADAVSSAIQFGVSAADFKRLIALLWDDELCQKRKRDAVELESK